MGLLDGKVAVITGAGNGLGRAHALAMAREGADIVVNDVAPAKDGGKRPAEAVCDEIKALGRKAVPHFEDISTTSGAETLVGMARSTFGKVDVLVNNAGILRDKTLKKMTDDEWDLVLKVHARGTFVCSRAAALAFAEQGKGGRIINTTSIAGLRGNFGQTNYSAAKAAIYALTRVHSMELQKDGVTVNAIAPIAKTQMTANIDSIGDDMAPEQVSPMLVFLASDLAKDVTGRIFGCHGNHYFEYEMKTSEGVKKAKTWLPQEIAAELDKIAKFDVGLPMPQRGAPAGGGGALTPAKLIEAALMNIEKAFKADKAAGWNAAVAWVVEGAGEYTVRVQDGKVKTEKGKAADATCVVTTGIDTLAGMIEGTVDPNGAFMKGQIKATKLPDLGKFGKVFVFDKAFVEQIKAGAGGGGGGAAAGGGSGPSTPADLVKMTFKNIEKAFVPEKAAGWNAVLTFMAEGAGAFTVRVQDGKVSTAEGAATDATCVVNTTADVMAGMIDGSVDANAAFMKGQIKATKLPDLGKFGKAFKFGPDFVSKIKSGAPAAAAPAAPAAPPADTVLLDGLVDALPKALDAEKAKGYKGVIFFEVEGSKAFSIVLDDGRCSIDRGPKPASVQCTVKTDAATLVGIFTGKVKGEEALAQKKLSAVPPTGLIKFRQAFRFSEDLLKAVEAAKPAPAEVPGEGLVSFKAVGKKYRGTARFAKPEAIQAYAEACSDRNGRYQAKAGKDQVGSAVFPVTFVMGLFQQAMSDPDLGIDFSRVVHGEQEIRFADAVHAQDLLAPRAQVTGIEKKSSGYLVNVRQTLNRDGFPVVEMNSGIFVRGHKKAEKKEEAAPEVRPAPLYTAKIKVDADQSVRYAKASGDDNPIHLDAEFAKSVGLPDRILHGLCSMAMAAGAIVEKSLKGDPTRLKMIKVRFSKPVLMGDELTLTAWQIARADRKLTIGFEVVSPRGEAVITNGVAEVLD